MTITLGLWLVPVVLTIAGFIHCLMQRPGGDYDFGPMLVFSAWVMVCGTAWAMYLLSLLFNWWGA